MDFFQNLRFYLRFRLRFEYGIDYQSIKINYTKINTSYLNYGIYLCYAKSKS